MLAIEDFSSKLVNACGSLFAILCKSIIFWTQSSVTLVRDPEFEMLHAFKYFSGIIYGTSNLPLMPGKAHLY